MADWGVLPDDILNNWTEERLALMFEKRNERIRAMMQPSDGQEQPQKIKRVSDLEFFEKMGVTVGRVN